MLWVIPLSLFKCQSILFTLPYWNYFSLVRLRNLNLTSWRFRFHILTLSFFLIFAKYVGNAFSLVGHSFVRWVKVIRNFEKGTSDSYLKWGGRERNWIHHGRPFAYHSFFPLGGIVGHCLIAYTQRMCLSVCLLIFLIENIIFESSSWLSFRSLVNRFNRNRATIFYIRGLIV
jgi:hypothetical protein